MNPPLFSLLSRSNSKNGSKAPSAAGSTSSQAGKIHEGYDFLEQTSKLLSSNRDFLDKRMGQFNERAAWLAQSAPRANKLTKGKMRPKAFHDSAQDLLTDVREAVSPHSDEKKYRRRTKASSISGGTMISSYPETLLSPTHSQYYPNALSVVDANRGNLGRRHSTKPKATVSHEDVKSIPAPALTSSSHGSATSRHKRSETLPVASKRRSRSSFLQGSSKYPNGGLAQAQNTVDSHRPPIRKKKATEDLTRPAHDSRTHSSRPSRPEEARSTGHHHRSPELDRQPSSQSDHSRSYHHHRHERPREHSATHDPRRPSIETERRKQEYDDRSYSRNHRGRDLMPSEDQAHRTRRRHRSEDVYASDRDRSRERARERERSKERDFYRRPSRQDMTLRRKPSFDEYGSPRHVYDPSRRHERYRHERDAYYTYSPRHHSRSHPSNYPPRRHEDNYYNPPPRPRTPDSIASPPPPPPKSSKSRAPLHAAAPAKKPFSSSRALMQVHPGSSSTSSSDRRRRDSMPVSSSSSYLDKSKPRPSHHPRHKAPKRRAYSLARSDAMSTTAPTYVPYPDDARSTRISTLMPPPAPSETSAGKSFKKGQGVGGSIRKWGKISLWNKGKSKFVEGL